MQAAARPVRRRCPSDRPIAFFFPACRRRQQDAARPWMIAALTAAREDPALRDAAASRREAKALTLSSAWVPVVRSASGRCRFLPPLRRRLDGVGGCRTVSRVVRCDSARAPDGCGCHSGLAQLEVEAISPSQLKMWTRTAGPIPPGASSRHHRAMRAGCGRWRSHCCASNG